MGADAAAEAGATHPPAIWVDADACPGAIRDMLCRAADRSGVMTTFVANQTLRLPPSRFVQVRQVPQGADEADRRIAAEAAPGDLVVTADIPLAAAVVAKGALAVGPRGERYDRDSVAQALAMRDFMADLREAGQIGGGPPPLGQADLRAFARELDRWIATRRAG